MRQLRVVRGRHHRGVPNVGVAWCVFVGKLRVQPPRRGLSQRPLAWCKLFALIVRLTLSPFQKCECRDQAYVDDPVFTVANQTRTALESCHRCACVALPVPRTGIDGRPAWAIDHSDAPAAMSELLGMQIQSPSSCAASKDFCLHRGLREGAQVRRRNAFQSGTWADSMAAVLK